jgi:two-component system cell cycle response regulator
VAGLAGRVLIAGELASSRIVLMSRLTAARCRVVGTPSWSEAAAEAAAKAPDLVVIDLAGQAGAGLDLCRTLRAGAATAALPILALARGPDVALRRAALAAGADDILDRQCGETLLLARVRALLRARGAEAELLLREDTRAALGFAEPAAGFEMPGIVALVTARPEAAEALRAALAPRLRDRIEVLTPAELAEAAGAAPARPRPDVYVVETDLPTADAGLALISDLRSDGGGRTAGIVALAPEGGEATAAAALDLGADDAVAGLSDPAELVLRLRAQLRRKAQADRLRRQISDGLRLAVTDPLTGLFNRRYAMSQLARIAAGSAATGRGFAVMVIDLDRFKRINDEFGHAAGDTVLAEAARRIRGALRAEDLVARLGGEEFLAAMPDTGPAEARAAAERLRQAIAAAPVDLPGLTAPIAVTASIGVAVGGFACQGDTAPTDLDTLMESADRALYSAKAEGRNKVTLGRTAA